MSDLAVRFAVVLGIFASVFLVSQVVLGFAWRRRQHYAAINRRLEMIRQGGDRQEIVARLRKNAPSAHHGLPGLLDGPYRAWQRMLFAADVPFTGGQIILAMLAGFLAVLALLGLGAGLAGFSWGGGTILLLVAVAASAAVLLPLTVLSMKAQARRKRVEDQFPVALDVFVRAMRSGHPIASAIELLTEEMDDPIGSEFGLVADEVSYGADLNDALLAMAERWDSNDMRMFVVSLSVQSETGGNLAEILENLADVIRARAAMYMKVRALSSEGRLTAWILSVLPVLTLVAMFALNPGFYLETARDPIFVFGFSGLILLYIVGFVWIRRMIDLKV
ncbi:MAG TPA: type II secretion system F family protein [Novosphingobium sp.]|nr:type II secretion system F family protein [Novosphingobium sp.]